MPDDHGGRGGGLGAGEERWVGREGGIGADMSLVEV